MPGTRVAPDNNDIIVWKLDESAAPFVNSSTSPNAYSHTDSDLTVLSGSVMLQEPSPFSAIGENSSVSFPGTQSGSPRNFISGANNAMPQPPITISCWIYLRVYDTGITQHFVNKQIQTGNWSSTFSCLGFGNRKHLGAPQNFDFYFVNTLGSTTPVVPADYAIPLNTWSHIGLTWDGVTQNGYINGVLVASLAISGTIGYGSSNFGPWFFGAIPSGSGSPEEGAYNICDVRVANVVRPRSYFQNIYSKGMLSSSATTMGITPSSNFYKLRVYDLACTEPTPVYWSSGSADLVDLPTLPCGNLNTISDLEIIEKWSILGTIDPPPGIADSLNGFVSVMPNWGNINSTTCTVNPSSSVFVTLGGNSSITYNVTLRFRGVVETKTYSGGTNDGAFFQIGGTPGADNFNTFQMTISNPAQTYYLNRGTTTNSFVVPVDYTKTIQMAGQSTITFTIASNDSVQNRNFDSGGVNPVTIPSISAPLQPYNGQFIRVDVVSVA